MPSPSLRSVLDSLAQSFANGVLAAIRTASLDELVADGGGAPRRGSGRPRGGGTTADSPKVRKAGRLPRRSPEQIAKALDRVVALVKKSKTGLRSEEIKKALGLDRREVPRVLQTGIAMKKLKATGQKRATTYTAA